MEKIVFSRRIVAGLELMGFNYIRTEQNPFIPNFECYVYEQSDELEAAMVKIAEAHKKLKNK